MNKNCIEVNLETRNHISATIRIPVREDPGEDWPLLFQSTLDQNPCLKSIVDILFEEEKEEPSAEDEPPF